MPKICREPGSARSAGFTLLEVVVVVLIALILTAATIPQISDTINRLRLDAAANSAAGAIAGARYQAIMHGFKYAVAFDPATLSYQLSDLLPGAATFTNVGARVPLSGASGMALSGAATLQCNPNGTVQATTGQMNFSITYSGLAKTITVSSLGDVSVTP